MFEQEITADLPASSQFLSPRLFMNNEAALCEDAARAEGFTCAELMATMAGEPLYRACGYVAVEPVVDDRGGVAVPLLRMRRFFG